MGLIDGICDSCGEPFDVLFPVGILDECPTGGMKHVQKWYCVTCKDTIEEEAETNANDDEDTDDDSISLEEAKEILVEDTLSFKEWFNKELWHIKK